MNFWFSLKQVKICLFILFVLDLATIHIYDSMLCLFVFLAVFINLYFSDLVLLLIDYFSVYFIILAYATQFHDKTYKTLIHLS